VYIDLRAIFAYVAADELVYTKRNYITANSSLIGLLSLGYFYCIIEKACS